MTWSPSVRLGVLKHHRPVDPGDLAKLVDAGGQALTAAARQALCLR